MARFDKVTFNRRQLLRASAVSAGAAAGASGFGAAAAQAAPGTAPAAVNPAAAVPAAQLGPGSTAPVRPFPLRDVRLGAGLLQAKRDRMKDFLSQYDERRFLVLFNNQAGRPNPPGVAVPGGWEDGGLLSGHWAGHYLTALAQAYADQGEAVFRDKLDWMVAELAACQAAITARMAGGGPGGEDPEEPEIGRIPGRFGNALRLNGPSPAQYVTLPQEAVNQLTDFTIAAWVHLGSTQNWTRLFDFGQSTTVNMFLTPRAGVTGNVPRFAITVGGSGQEQQISGTAALPTNQWVHLAVTLSQNTGTLYVDGQPVGTNSEMTLNPTSLGNPGNRWIGRSQYPDPFLDAAIDEFHIFDRALSQPELLSLLDSAAGRHRPRRGVRRCGRLHPGGAGPGRLARGPGGAGTRAGTQVGRRGRGPHPVPRRQRLSIGQRTQRRRRAAHHRAGHAVRLADSDRRRPGPVRVPVFPHPLGHGPSRDRDRQRHEGGRRRTGDHADRGAVRRVQLRHPLTGKER